jgi:hypothetical protein
MEIESDRQGILADLVLPGETITEDASFMR